MATTSSLDIHFAARALLRFRRRALGFLAVSLLLVIAAILLAPRQYESEARLFLRVGRESVSLDPTATTGQMIALNETRQNEVNSALELLRNRALQEQVVDRLGPEFFLDPPASPPAEAPPADKPAAGGSRAASLVQLLHALGALDPVDRREKAVRVLHSSLESWVPRNTHIIAIACRADTPERAQAMVNTTVECFSEAHLRAHRTAGSHGFFAEQAADLQRQLEDASRRLQQRKSEFGLLSIAGRRALLEQEQTAVQQELTTTQAQLAASRAKLVALTGSVRQLPERQITEQVEGLPNLAADNMRNVLYQLEIQEQELASQLTDEHPRLLAVRQQRHEVTDILQQQPSSRTQMTTAVHPTHAPLQLAMLVEAAEREGWQARLTSLQADQARLASSVERLNRQELEIAGLERELALLETDYQSYAERREQSRIDQVLAEERISNLNLVQPATLVRKPVSPRKALTLLLGLLGGITGAVALALLSAWLDRSFATAAEVEDALQLPVLLTVPRWEPTSGTLPLANLEASHDQLRGH